jgi:phosphate transport system protein
VPDACAREAIVNEPITRHDLPPVEGAPSPMRTHFQDWLDQIDDELVGGALLVSASLPRITRAWVVGDRACIAEARSMVSDVCERTQRVDQQGLQIIALEAPVGGDLRRLVAMLRLVFSIERSAALLLHVAETVERMDPRGLPEEVREQAEELGRRASEVFRSGVDAWRSRDGLAVHELNEADDIVDRLAVGLLESADAVESPAEAMALAQLARYWERIADHGVSFAQHSTFSVTGERVEVGR